MAWSKKKILAKIGSYFENKHIPYKIKDDSMIELEFYFKEKGYILYPYLTINPSLCSVDINISKHSLKNFNYEFLNEFNQKSKFFKAFINEEGVVVMEYRFFLNDLDIGAFDAWIESVYMLENDIEFL